MLELIKDLLLAVVMLTVFVLFGYGLFMMLGVVAFVAIPATMMIVGCVSMLVWECMPVNNKRPEWHVNRG